MQNATPADLTGTVREVQAEFRDRYKATDVRVSTDDDTVDVRLEFRGFTDLEAALERISDVARELDHNHDADVTAGVNSGGFDYPHPHDEEEPDTRPAGWVTATFPGETREG